MGPTLPVLGLELLIAVASLIAKRRPQGVWASVAAAHESSVVAARDFRAQALYCGARVGAACEILPGQGSNLVPCIGRQILIHQQLGSPA